MCVPLGHGMRGSRSSYSYNSEHSVNRYYLYQIKTVREDGTAVETEQIKCGTRKDVAISEAKRAARQSWSKGSVVTWTLSLFENGNTREEVTGGYDKDRKLMITRELRPYQYSIG